MRITFALIVLALSLTEGAVSAQGAPIKGRAKSFSDVAEVSVTFDPPKARPGDTVALRITVTPKPSAWTYPTSTPPDQLSKNTIVLPKSDDLTFVGGVTDPGGWKEKPSADDPNRFDLYYPSEVTWEAKAVVSPTAKPGRKTLALEGSAIQACNDSNCFYLKKLEAELEIVEPPPGTGPVVPPPGTNSVVRDGQDSGLLGLLVTAAIWGFVSLVTPCVFPMIPITVSLFLKQSQQSSTSPVKLAAVYCLTIVLVLGGGAAFLLPIFKALSTNPYTNILLGLLLFVFALSLFGMFDLTLPGFLLRSAERGRASGGLVGTVFGAVAFSIVSFTCVAPFLGGFASMVASGKYSTAALVLAGLVFAVAFASPFFVLALFPSWLKRMPKSGGWLDTIKAVMGFLELAAAVKFFRAAEFFLLPEVIYFTYDVCMAAWVVIAGVCGLYLLNLFRLPHDEERPNIGVARMIFAIAFFGLAAHLLPALFKTEAGENQQPRGVVYAWVDSFLLPAPPTARPTVEATATGGKADAPSSSHGDWKIDLPAEVARISKELQAWEAKRDAARAANPNSPPPPLPERRFIFIDFTGMTCTNCKLNERRVFPRPEVKELMAQYTLVALYTDIVPNELYDSPRSLEERKAQAKANETYQREKYLQEQLPLYVILEPQANGEPKLVEVYDEGKINNVPAFVAFLKRPLGVK